MTSAIVVMCLFLTVGEATPPTGRKPPPAVPATPTAGQAPQPAPKDAAGESLEMRYARTRLKLAQANLERVEQMNRKLDRTVPSSVVEDLKREAGAAELRFQEASAEKANGFDVWVRRAENVFRSATTRWQNALTANKAVKDMIPALDVERFRLRAEVAQLQWERGRALAKAPRDVQLAWQVELLSDEVDLLREDSSRAGPAVRYYPIWMY